MEQSTVQQMRVGDRLRFGQRFWIVRLPKGYGVVDLVAGCRMTHFSDRRIRQLFVETRRAAG